MKKPHIIIAGAGLAGTAAAYELSKNQDVTVELIDERDVVGGRVMSLEVEDQYVDFGGFIIYPWYKEYNRIAKETGIEKHYKSIPLKPIYYEIDEDGTYTADKDIKFSRSAQNKLIASSLGKFAGRLDLSNPPLEKFSNMSVADYIRGILPNEDGERFIRYTDMVLQGYCYAGVEDYKMSISAPVAKNTTFRGNIKKAFYVSGNSALYPKTLAEHAERGGVEINLQTKITKLGKKSITTSDGVKNADAIILAYVPEPDDLHEIYEEPLPKIENTHFYSAVLKFSGHPKVNDHDDWGAIFYRPRPDLPIQILTSINLAGLHNGKIPNYLNVNIIVREEGHPLSKEDLTEKIRVEVATLFPEVDFYEITHLAHWPKAMPVANESALRYLREHQGKEGFYFAGDYLGSPSMEVAVATGVKAARHVIEDLT